MRNHKRAPVSTRRPAQRRKKTNRRPRLHEIGGYQVGPFLIIRDGSLTMRQKIALWWNDLTDWESYYGIAIVLMMLVMLCVGAFCHRSVKPAPKPHVYIFPDYDHSIPIDASEFFKPTPCERERMHHLLPDTEPWNGEKK